MFKDQIRPKFGAEELRRQPFPHSKVSGLALVCSEAHAMVVLITREMGGAAMPPFRAAEPQIRVFRFLGT